MPVTVAPADIEQSDFSVGYSPDGQDMNDPGALKDVWNLLIDPATGGLETRKGFDRVVQLTTDTGFRCVALHHFYRNGGRKFIAVITDDTSNANNVRVFEVDPLDSWSKTRIDTNGVTWSHPSSYHWGISVDGVYYGGSPGNEMYSWDGSTWDATAATGNWKTAVNDIGSSVTEATEYAKDYAYKGTEKVFYGGDVYSPNRSIRYDRWGALDTTDSYRKGDRVTNTVSGDGYPTSYVCILAHDPSSATTEPGNGGTWRTYWRKVQLPLPTDSDGVTNTDSWDFVIIAPQTSVGVWYADRMWLRADDQGDKSRLTYSAPIKPVKGEDIGDTEFDPKDFTPANDNRGEGGGWIEFNDGKHQGAITGATVYDQYLVVFKGTAVWVLSGASSTSFTPRRLARGIGNLCETSFCQHGGLLYFVGNDGLNVTDGTTAIPVPGSEKVREYIRHRIDNNQSDDSKFKVECFSWRDFVFFSIPTDGIDTNDGDFLTLAYHPESQSFWKTNLPIQVVTKVNVEGVQNLYFAPQGNYGTSETPYIMEYTGNTDDLADDAHTQDDMFWYLQTAWWSFGLERHQRRIRRTWALVKGAMDYTLGISRDYDSSTEADITRTRTDTFPGYIEGQWVPDAHAIQFYLDGLEAPAAVHGIAVETEPRRKRYHTN